MNGLVCYASRVAVRRVVVIVVLALLAWVGVGRAEAQTIECYHSSSGVSNASLVSQACTQGFAYAQCVAARDSTRAAYVAQHPQNEQFIEVLYDCSALGAGPPLGSFRCYMRVPGTHDISCVPEGWSSSGGGGYWYYHTGTECPYGVLETQPDGCAPGPEECLARNGEGFGVPTVKPFTERCVSGCWLRMDANGGTCTTVEGQMLCNASYEFDGNTCSASPSDPPTTPEEEAGQDPQECVPTNGGINGQQFCKKNDGSECYSAADGRKICWQPGETGEKNDGPVRQKRDAGTQPQPLDNVQLPSGDSLSPQDDPVQAVTNTNNVQNIVTVVQNYGTQNGTNANGGGSAGADQGENSDGSGGDEGEGEDGSASGGGDCQTPPTSSDPVVGQVADQVWRQRCADEKAREDGKADRTADTNGLNADSDAMESEFGENVFGEWDATGSINENWISFGGGGCPDLSVAMPWGDTWAPPPEFCQLVAALALLFKLIAYVWALRIVGDA